MVVLAIIVLTMVLLTIGVPVVFTFGLATIAMALVAWPGLLGLNVVAINSYTVVTEEGLLALPLFVFMAEVVIVSGLGVRVFDAIQRLFWRVPGGLASASMISCIGFAAITGSSAANTATVGSIGLREMLARNYNSRLATGAIAAGGGLGILLPPSTFMVVYGSMTNTAISDLFIAGILPGLMLGGMFLAYIVVRAVMNPSLTPRVRYNNTLRDIGTALFNLLPLLVLMGGILGGIYAGVATPTEIAAIGVVGALLLAYLNSGMNLRRFIHATERAVVITCMIFWIMIGTWSFGYILNYMGVGAALADFVQSIGAGQLVVLLTINIVLILLGTALDPPAILMLVTPLIIPILHAAEINFVWFGIIYAINMELAVISPPVGINLFIMKGIAPESVTINDIMAGTVPFMLIQAAAIAIIMLVPEIALWLPGMVR